MIFDEEKKERKIREFTAIFHLKRSDNPPFTAKQLFSEWI
jgi:hypothetical protein